MPQFEHYIGIDYSGAKTPSSPLPGLRVFSARRAGPSSEEPARARSKHWTRRGIAEWLVSQLSGNSPIIVGIDHAFSFPLQYFERHRLPKDWLAFMSDFHRHWPTDADDTSVEFLRHQNKRNGETSWFRKTELWTATAKSVFLFDVQGAVAKSTHAGLPWLRFIRERCRNRVHFWPFDGWEIPAGRSTVAEVYPSLWTRRFPKEHRNGDQHAAYAVAEWLRLADANGSLARHFNPPLDPQLRSEAQVEGWILGVT